MVDRSQLGNNSGSVKSTGPSGRYRSPPLGRGPVITVPTSTLEDDANGAPHPDPTSYAKKFSGEYSHWTIRGRSGHNLPQKAPRDFATALVEVAGY